MSQHPFSFLQADLEWLERALSAVVDDWEASTAPDGWDKYWSKAELVRSAERSLRRQIKVRHCVFGPGQSCKNRMVPSCDVCAGSPNDEAMRIFGEKGAA